MDPHAAAASPEVGTTYDEIPYPSHPFRATHPDHLHSLARLFKLDAALPDDASILELGCAGGGNIIPLAVQMPRARVVGVDLSSRQIADGMAMINELGLGNIRLLAQDFQSIDESFGQFDYIICHGVFSWVPESAQQRILEVCKERLAPNGMAYISYNAYPGWFMRGMIRQMMLQHVGQFAGATTKVRQARALLSFIVEALDGQDTPYAAIVKAELDLLAKQPDSYLYHEHLEENNRPMFFTDFMRMAHAHGLQFVSETSLATMVTSNLPPKAADALTRLTGDIIQRSQYTDFVTNRVFRQTVLCRAGQPLDRQLDVSRLAGALVRAPLSLVDPEQAGDMSEGREVAFTTQSGRRMSSSSLPLKAVAYTLIDAWPQSLSVQEICDRALRRLQSVGPMADHERTAIAQLMRGSLLQMLVRGDLDVRFMADRFLPVLTERPAVSPLTRLQSRTGGPLTTAVHTMHTADPLARLLVQAVDGTRTREDLLAHFQQLVSAGKVTINAKDGQPVDLATGGPLMVESVLQSLRTNALLVG